MIEKGFMLMMTGMGVVFLFLSILVIVMYGTASFFKNHPSMAEKEEKKTTKKSKKAKRTDKVYKKSKTGKKFYRKTRDKRKKSSSDDEVVAAVAAVQAFSNKN